MSNLFNMVMAAVLNLISPATTTLPQADSTQTIEAVIECEIQEDYTAAVIRFETENC